MRILLVDDEPGIREGLAALLRLKGHEVLTAGDCRRAGALLAEEELDLVVTDWRLPDGRASEFVARAGCPVVAMSGHPEEVEGHQGIGEVLTKPVMPARLVELVARHQRPDDPGHPEIARDVTALIAAARRILGAAGELADDGVFVVLRAPLADDGLLGELAGLGGDLRVLAPRAEPTVELRWCRDGRPDTDVPVFRPDARWPAAGEFAVDFQAAGVAPEQFGACLDRAAAATAGGARVHFLNIPAPLLSWASDQGRTDDMPMRAAVGPRLPAVLADLWS